MSKIKYWLLTLVSVFSVGVQVHADTKEYVDLGLPSGTLWATCDVGASAPEEVGKKYAWGETTENKGASWDNYFDSTDGYTFSKYKNNEGKTVLDNEDDAAYVNWGSDWRMPTKEEFAELFNSSYTSCEYTEINGAQCLRITSLSNGSSIFLPAIGIDLVGQYWTSTLSEGSDEFAHYAYFAQVSSTHADVNNRNQLLSVRPVYVGELPPHYSDYELTDGVLKIKNPEKPLADLVAELGEAVDDVAELDITGNSPNSSFVNALKNNYFPNLTRMHLTLQSTAEATLSALHLIIGDENLSKVISLKVIGSINSYDIMIFNNKMINLQNLDLGEATIEANSYEYYPGYPSKANQIDRYAIPSKLKSLVLPSTLRVLGDYALANCVNIEEIDLPNSVTTIGKYAFTGCTALKSLKMNEDSDLRRIEDYAFNNCNSLLELSIPDEVTYIALHSYEGCTGLKTIKAPIFYYDEKGVEQGNLNCFSSTHELQSIRITKPKTVTISLFGVGIKSDVDLYIGDGPTWLSYARGGSFNSLRLPRTLRKISSSSGCTITTKTPLEIPIDNVLVDGSLDFDTYGNEVTIGDNWTFNGPLGFYYSNNTSISKLKIKGGKININVNPRAYPKILEIENLNSWLSNSFANENKNLLFWGAKFYVNGELLTNLMLDESITSIPDYAFYNCNQISSVNLPSSLNTIGNYAFSGCTKMSNITASSELESIGNYAFQNCTALTNIVFPRNSKLKTILNYAFTGCTSLQEVSLPTSITTIGDYAFQNCNRMTEIRLPSSITKIGNSAFAGCTVLNDVYTYAVEPQTINQNTFSTYRTATLHCPAVSYYNYYYDTQWSQFLKLENFDEPIDYVYVTKDFYIYTESTGTISGKPRMDIAAGGGVSVMQNGLQEMGDIHLTYDVTANKSASLIGNNNLSADNLFVDINVKADFWHYFCFPFDVDLTKIQKEGSYVFRRYDSSLRAANGSGGWQDVEGTTLEAGKGYIFRTNRAGTLSIPVANPNLEAKNEQTELGTYGTEETVAANRNWNFCGNRYLAYYDINDLSYTAPIIVWNGTTYVAYRPGDDEYTLTPFQAFFVQKPDAVVEVGFDKEGRTTYLRSLDANVKAAKRRAKAANLNPDRQLVNLILSDGESEDRTRVVFNNRQTMDYEMECDASKFTTEGTTAQLYSLDTRGIRYAINERPVGNGSVQLGFIAGLDGFYTLSAQRMDVPMYLHDRLTGDVHDLSVGEYSFHAEAGTDQTRFVLSTTADATAIQQITADGETTQRGNTYNVAGQRVGSGSTQKGIRIQQGKKILVK